MDFSISHPEEQIRWLWLLAAGLPPLLCFAAYAVRIRRDVNARRWDVILAAATLVPSVLVVTFLVIEPSAREDLAGALHTFMMVSAVSAVPTIISSEVLRRLVVRAGASGTARFTTMAVGSLVVGLALTLGGLVALSVGLADF